MRSLLGSTVLFITALMLLSCDGGIKPEESISVSPENIEAEVSLASYEMILETESPWTAELRGEGAAEVSWITLSKSKGTGGAKITARVFENKYKEVRTATVVFKTAGGAEASVKISQKGKESGEELSSISLRVGSYNLRMSTISESDAANSWAARKERLQVSIQENDFDVVGMQEVSTTTQNWLVSTFGTEYTCIFFSPYSQGGTGDKAQAILYRTAKFKASDPHFFWASSTPESCTTNDDGSQGSFKRGGHCVTLAHKETGVQFFFMNTHACLNPDPNALNAPVYEQMEKKYNPNGLPSFFVGDMNARPDSPATVTYLGWWKDSYSTAAARSGANASYNAFSYASGKSRIDYIYHRGSGITVKEFCINNTLYDSKYASDHFPIWADVEIRK